MVGFYWRGPTKEYQIMKLNRCSIKVVGPEWKNEHFAVEPRTKDEQCIGCHSGPVYKPFISSLVFHHPIWSALVIFIMGLGVYP